MWKRPLRLGVYVLVGFVIGSLILGTIKGNPFVTNLVYGLWTGAIAGAVVAIVVFGVLTLRRRR
jgi:ABC-type enterobactin transport system permease subunit